MNDPVPKLIELTGTSTNSGADAVDDAIRQAEAMGEFALSETFRGIIVQEQEHEIDLASALGI